MGWLGAAAQCVADFIVDERCHACGARPRGAPGESPPCALARPVRLALAGRVSLSTRVLCEACARAVRPWASPVCIGAGTDGAGPGRALDVYPAFETDERLLEVVHLMKFRRRRRLAPWLAAAMADALPARALESLPAPPLLVAVPMDRASRARRGFNQAECMAVELSRRWGIDLAGDALRKPHRTRAQSSLGREARWRNLARAFAPGRDDVTGRTVILVDDLVTTGATASACAAVLHAAGVEAVRVVCAGYRTPAGEGCFLQS